MGPSYLVIPVRFIIKTLLPVTRLIPSKRVQAAGLGLALAFPLSAKSIKKYIKPSSLQDIPTGLADYIAQGLSSNVVNGTNEAESIFQQIFPHLSTLSDIEVSNTLNCLMNNDVEVKTLAVVANRCQNTQQKKDVFLQIVSDVFQKKLESYSPFARELYFQWKNDLNGGDFAYTFKDENQLSKKQRKKRDKKRMLYIQRCIHYVDCVVLNDMLKNLEQPQYSTLQTIPYSAFNGLFNRTINQDILDTVEEKWGVNTLLNIHLKAVNTDYSEHLPLKEQLEPLCLHVAQELNRFYERQEAQRVKQVLLDGIEHQRLVECNLYHTETPSHHTAVSKKRKL